jgi:beta-N-acetylhexosaminidase
MAIELPTLAHVLFRSAARAVRFFPWLALPLEQKRTPMLHLLAQTALIAAFAAGPLAAAPADPSTRPSFAALDADAEAWVAGQLSSMTLRDKVAQMVMPWIPGGTPRTNGAEWRRARRLVTEDRVGGLIVGVGAANTTASWLNQLQRLSTVPLLVSADLEWGAGTRLRGATVLPINMAIAAAGDPALAYEAGRITAREARAAGIHVAFAPVADVNVNPLNPVINTRAYGAEAALVSSYVESFVRGAQAGGVLAVAKHFPGHGDVEQDSHLALPFLEVDRLRLDSVELVPFRAAIGAGVAGVMSAHLVVPSLTLFGLPIPATLSRTVMTGLLREELGFDGLLFTDALVMEGIRSGRQPGRTAVSAVLAGADVLLMPVHAREAIDSVVAAVLAGYIAEDRIDASVRRILAAKASVGLNERRAVPLNRVTADVSPATHRRWAQDVANRSLTLLRYQSGSLPYERRGGRVLSIRYDDPQGRQIGAAFDQELRERGYAVRPLRLWRRSSEAELRRAVALADSVDVVVISSYARSLPWKGTLGLPEDIAEFLDGLAARGAVVITFGDPYVVAQLPRAETFLLAWSDAEVAQRAAARALAGEIAIGGRLPIPLPPEHGIGSGIDLARARPLDRRGE